jgi:hypothetical protein
MSDHEPPHRKQRHPLPDSATVIAAARQRRQDVLDALHPWTQSIHSEHQREAADDDQGTLDNDNEEG